jgi:hypothetical protein
MPREHTMLIAQANKTYYIRPLCIQFHGINPLLFLILSHEKIISSGKMSNNGPKTGKFLWKISQ